MMSISLPVLDHLRLWRGRETVGRQTAPPITAYSEETEQHETWRSKSYYKFDVHLGYRMIAPTDMSEAEDRARRAEAMQYLAVSLYGPVVIELNTILGLLHHEGFQRGDEPMDRLISLIDVLRLETDERSPRA